MDNHEEDKPDYKLKSKNLKADNNTKPNLANIEKKNSTNYNISNKFDLMELEMSKKILDCQDDDTHSAIETEVHQ